MAKIYWRLIKAGLWELDNVPERWKSEVEKLIEEDSNV